MKLVAQALKVLLHYAEPECGALSFRFMVARRRLVCIYS